MLVVSGLNITLQERAKVQFYQIKKVMKEKIYQQ